MPTNRHHTSFDRSKFTLTGPMGHVFNTVKQAGLEPLSFVLTAR